MNYDDTDDEEEDDEPPVRRRRTLPPRAAAQNVGRAIREAYELLNNPLPVENEFQQSSSNVLVLNDENEPLTAREIDNLPMVTITPHHVESEESCPICGKKYKLFEIVNALPCIHLYHFRCIGPWLKKHRKCPLCQCIVNF